MKRYLIIYKNTSSSEQVKERIKIISKNDYIGFFDNHFIIYTSIDSCKQVYEELVNGVSEPEGILVLRIEDKDDNGYWGIMAKEVWDWLDSHPNE